MLSQMIAVNYSHCCYCNYYQLPVLLKGREFRTKFSFGFLPPLQIEQCTFTKYQFIPGVLATPISGLQAALNSEARTICLSVIVGLDFLANDFCYPLAITATMLQHLSLHRIF